MNMHNRAGTIHIRVNIKYPVKWNSQMVHHVGSLMYKKRIAAFAMNQRNSRGTLTGRSFVPIESKKCLPSRKVVIVHTS